MDYEEGPIDLNRELVASPLSTVLMRVQGEAMVADGLCDGDLVVIDRALDPRPGCLVVAIWEGRFIVRRLSRGPDPGQCPRLEASDGVSAPIALDDGQGNGARLWGVVRHAVHRLASPASKPPCWHGQEFRPPADDQDTGRRKEGARSPRRRSSR
jgi:DNA polymerase V